MLLSPAPPPPSITKPPMLLLSPPPTFLYTTTSATRISTPRQPWKPLPILLHFATSRKPLQKLRPIVPYSSIVAGSTGDGSDGGGGLSNWWGRWSGDDDDDNNNENENEDVNSHKKRLLFYALLSSLCFSFLFHSASRAYAIASGSETGSSQEEVIWEVKGGKRTKLIPDHFRDVFVAPHVTWAWWPSSSSSKSSSTLSFGNIIPNMWVQCRELFMRLMLPEGYPDSVTSDYLEYSLWRGVQGIAAQVSGVLATQSLLYAVGLGKGAIPTAAAVNWVLKDGIGYLSKIFLSKFGRHFDVNPKGWRLFADFMENAAFGMEILTPVFLSLSALFKMKSLEKFGRKFTIHKNDGKDRRRRGINRLPPIWMSLFGLPRGVRNVNFV